MSVIHVDPPTASGRTLRTTISSSRGMSRFFSTNEFVATYDTDIETVPESQLVIPVLSQVAPVAWAAGADVSVRTVDPIFADALEAVQSSMMEMYDFFDGGSIRIREPERIQSTNPASQIPPQDGEPVGGSLRMSDDGSKSEDIDTPSSGLLFTGGVDSTCSYLRHRAESPVLITIRGWTIRPGEADDEKWRHQVERTRQFASTHELDTGLIEANMLSFLNHGMLLAHYKRFVDGAWYSSVGHGLGLLGLCAPFAAARGIDDIYIAATHWDGIDLEWGSRPDIDDNVRWQGTNCHHDCYDLTRQERIDLIAEYVETEKRELQLQTCNNRMDHNCGSCEKCYRTAVGLELSGLDPTVFGYDFRNKDYERIRRSFESGEWVLGLDEQYMWEDLRKRTDDCEPDSPAEEAFFDWLQTTDLSSHVNHSVPPRHESLIRAIARHTPTSLFNVLYPAWSHAKAGYDRFARNRTAE